MKKRMRLAGLVLALLVIASLFGGTAAFAADSEFIQFPDGFQSVTELNKSDMKLWEVDISDPGQTLRVTSSDADVLEAQLDELAEGSGAYLLTVFAWEAGEATLTFTASNGASVSHTITVADKPVQKDYTLTSDTTSDFSLVQGNSYMVKLHYVAGGSAPDYSAPMLLTDVHDIIGITLVDVDSANNDYFYLVNAVGNVGQSADLYMTNLEYVPEKLCNVKIGVNKNLSLDTNASTIYKSAKPEFLYTCNMGDTYRFVAYTNSATAPKVSVSGSSASASYIGRVPGGYEYRMKALEWGLSVVRVTLNGETASFPVAVAEELQPLVKSDTPKSISLEKGKSYTFKFTVMGGGEPSFTAGTGGVVSIQTVKKEGINYFVKITGTGNAQTGTSLNVTFPQSGGTGFDQNMAAITLTQPKPIPPKSDTNSNFSVKQGLSYTFKITGAVSFNAGTPGVFKTEKVGVSGNDAYYKITAIGKPGQQAGFYMTAAGQAPQKVCVVAVDPPAPVLSDTNADFKLAKNASYQFKITAPGATAVNFNAGSAGVLQVSFVKRVGNDFYYKITATGRSGDASGIYVSLPGQNAKKLCVVSIA